MCVCAFGNRKGCSFDWNGVKDIELLYDSGRWKKKVLYFAGVAVWNFKLEFGDIHLWDYCFSLTVRLLWRSFLPPSFQSHFQFYGVYSGSQRAILFVLTNHSSAEAWVTLDRSEYTEFSLQLPQASASMYLHTACVWVICLKKIRKRFCPMQTGHIIIVIY